MSERQEPPLGWSAASLSEVARINPPLDRCPIDEDTEVCFVPMRAVATEGGGLIAPERRLYREVKKGYTAFLSGDVIMAKITPCTENGKTTVVPDVPGQICFGSTEFHTIRPEQGVQPKWIERFLLQHETRRNAQRAMAGGVGQMRVPAEFLKTLTIPVAPTREQSRIAETLDELFSDLDAGVAALERARERLKLYRASVLRAAVEGALTDDWRRRNPQAEPGAELLKRILVERRQRWEQDQTRTFQGKGKTPPKNWRAKYKEPVVPDTAELPALPRGWCWASLDQLGKLDRGRSRHRPRNAGFLYGGAYPFIQTGDVKGADRHLRHHTQTYSEAGLRQSRLWPAETLCITIAANIAETAILAYPACFPDSIVGVLFDPSLVSVGYVELFVQSARDQISVYAPATAQKNINNRILRALAIPLPPLSEQLAIVEAVDDQFSAIEHLEADIEAKLDRAQALRQAILKHAFSGKLVPQDPKDEPAAELLGRIAAKREAREEKAASAGRSARVAGKARRRRRPRTSKT